jgi:hypothetical protein
MKKNTTMVNQSDKSETMKSEPHVRAVTTQKFYRDHKFSDHSHGRVNRSFGANHEPGTM